MLLGIDVGGTFTDAVVLRQGEVVAQAKRATTHDDVLQCVLAALDAVLQPGMAQELERVVISSTIVTNALTEGSLPPLSRLKQRFGKCWTNGLSSPYIRLTMLSRARNLFRSS